MPDDDKNKSTALVSSGDADSSIAAPRNPATSKPDSLLSIGDTVVTNLIQPVGEPAVPRRVHR
jgi:hypothetical protein